MGPLTGLGRLTRLALRRDKIKLPLWVLSIGLLFILTTSSVASIYSTEAERVAYASASVVSAAAKAFNGPVLGPSLGSVVLTESFLFYTLMAAFMSTLLVIRHTRQNEELGRSELVGAAIVGRHAPMAAALLAAVIANVAVGLFVLAGFLTVGLPVDGSILGTLSFVCVGIIFAAIAAVAAQLTQTARAANGLAAAAIGAMFVLRAIGDIQGKVQASGLAVESAWPTWLSPFGIARNSEPFVQNNWWVLLPLAGLVLAFVVAAYALADHRDMGAGLLPTRRGRPVAKKGLLSSLGLVWRLQRGLLIGWVVGLGLMAIALGSVATEMDNFADGSEQMQQIVSQIGGSQNLVDAYLSFSIMIIGVAVAAYAMQALLRVRTEETTGHLELLLATHVDRKGWLLAHMLIVAFGALLLLVVCGGIAGLTHGILANDVAHWLPELLGASVAYMPVAFLFASIAVLLFGVLPGVVIAGSWLVFAIAYLIVQVGALLQLPQWLQDMSPFSHIPMAPAEDIAWTPLLVMCGIALAMTVIGVLAFRRRDLSTA